jgi:hypothetical protein
LVAFEIHERKMERGKYLPGFSVFMGQFVAVAPIANLLACTPDVINNSCKS